MEVIFKPLPRCTSCRYHMKYVPKRDCGHCKYYRVGYCKYPFREKVEVDYEYVCSDFKPKPITGIWCSQYEMIVSDVSYASCCKGYSKVGGVDESK